MENIKKSTKKLKDYYISSMLNILLALKNNIQIKEKLNESIINNEDEKEIIYYTKILTNNNSLILGNSIILLNNFFQITKSYETTLKNIKNEILTIQKLLISNYENQIKNLFDCNASKEIEESKKDKYNTYLNLIDLDKKYNKLLKINWDLVDFKDYFSNSGRLKNNIAKIYSDLVGIF